MAQKMSWMWVWAVLLVLAADQASKLAIEKALPPDGFRVVIPGLFNLANTRNRGVAFGLLANARQPWMGGALVIFSCAVMIFLVWMLLAGREEGTPAEWGMSLILGGAAGNILDRMIHGSVTDFLDFYWRGFHWYTFNLADTAIVTGAGLVLLGLFRDQRHPAVESA
jgi:signal peptidase II